MHRLQKAIRTENKEKFQKKRKKLEKKRRETTMRSLIRIAFAQRLHNYAWTYLCFYVDHLSRWQCMYISDYVFSVLAFHIYCAHWLFIYNGKIWLGLNSNWKMLKRFKIHTYIYIEACGAETINWSSFLKFHFFFLSFVLLSKRKQTILKCISFRLILCFFLCIFLPSVATVLYQ